MKNRSDGRDSRQIFFWLDARKMRDAAIRTAAPDTFAPGPARRNIVLALAMLVLFMHLIDRQIMAILAEPIKADVGLSDTQIGLLTGLGFSLLYSILGIPLARLADRFDRVHILSAATAVWSAMTIVTGMTGSFITMMASRMGVAAGEAGGIPPLHSLIADLFVEEHRARAFSIVQLGGPLGVLVAFFGGGFLVAAFDWRTVFYVAGGLGLLLVPLLLWLMPEPRRNVSTTTTHTPEPFWASMSLLIGQRAFVYLVFGAAFAGMGLYAMVIWAPSFLIRSFELPIENVGVVLGLAFGVLGAVAVLGAGQIADWVRRFDDGAHASVPAIMMAAAAPLSVAGLLASTMPYAMAFLLIPIMAMSAWQAPVIAAIQCTATARTRALAAALFMFVLNFVGLGFGPFLVGLASDHLNAQHGANSLRFALLIVPAAFTIAALFWLLAAREIRAPIDRNVTDTLGAPAEEAQT